ncbi:MAG: chaperone modulator CbpM [Flavobacteriales bacterium]
MSTDQHIPLELFCRHEEVDIAVVRAFHQRGLIHLCPGEQDYGIPAEELPHLERLLRLHRELEINLEGVEAISHLLERMERLQEEVRGLRARLRLYEREEGLA